MSSINSNNHHPPTTTKRSHNHRYQLLEINVISAQDLATLSKSMHTYAVAWINPSRKLTTLVDPKGHNNPTWNDKFVFRVDNEFINSDTAVVMIEIYSQAWLRDVIVGSVRVLVSSLIPHQKSSTRFVALQIRRPSGRPQGILNVGVSLVDGVMKSMPLYSELGSSGLGYTHNNAKSRGSSMLDINVKDEDNDKKSMIMSKLRRTKSDGTWSIKDHQQQLVDGGASSICNGGGGGGGGSVVGTEISAAAAPPGQKKGKGGSINHNGSSLCSDVGPSPSVVAAAVAKGIYPLRLGPNNNYNKGDDGSSILQWADADDNESVEGLRSKLERWRMEIGRPSAAYDDGRNKRNKYMGSRQIRSKRRRSGRRSSSGGETGGDRGGYSCFAKVFGCEFTIVCGASPSRKYSSKVHLSPSDDQNSDSYVV